MKIQLLVFCAFGIRSRCVGDEQSATDLDLCCQVDHNNFNASIVWVDDRTEPANLTCNLGVNSISWAGPPNQKTVIVDNGLLNPNLRSGYIFLNDGSATIYMKTPVQGLYMCYSTRLANESQVTVSAENTCLCLQTLSISSVTYKQRDKAEGVEIEMNTNPESSISINDVDNSFLSSMIPGIVFAFILTIVLGLFIYRMLQKGTRGNALCQTKVLSYFGGLRVLDRTSRDQTSVDYQSRGLDNDIYHHRQVNEEVHQQRQTPLEPGVGIVSMGEILFTTVVHHSTDTEQNLVPVPNQICRTTNKKKSELNYVEVQVKPSANRVIGIRRKLDQTSYSEIDFTKKADPLPYSSSDEDNI